MENNKGLVETKSPTEGIWGYSKDGSFWIRIQMSEDGKISSFFPDFDYKPK
ncbi:hypothetical protein CSA08_01990 [Candidatus Gracilibacteria bacterium]|nr:MAG: hypothetical protein CSA08_01990 [Candidatus Gracilibacteria bacterium]